MSATDTVQMNMQQGEPVLELSGLQHWYAGSGLLNRGARLQALRGVDLTVGRGEVLGVVGESGCGKSTLARIALGLLKPTSGAVKLSGTPIQALSGLQRSGIVQPVFQDPSSSLNPTQRIADIVSLPARVHRIGTAANRQQDAARLMDLCGLPSRFADRYPVELSGGQRQRVAIARALILQPLLLVLDEPTSALDVSVQAQILNLLLELRRSQQLSYLLISHNLGVVRYLADRVAVMYFGTVVEMGRTEEIFTRPRHPYTRMLLAAIPRIRFAENTGTPRGEPPDPSKTYEGCAFSSRCSNVMDACQRSAPQLITRHHHAVSCHLF